MFRRRIHRGLLRLDSIIVNCLFKAYTQLLVFSWNWIYEWHYPRETQFIFQFWSL